MLEDEVKVATDEMDERNKSWDEQDAIQKRSPCREGQEIKIFLDIDTSAAKLKLSELKRMIGEIEDTYKKIACAK